MVYMRMKDLNTEALRHIDRIAWDDSCGAEQKLQAIQNILYQHEAMSDDRSIRCEEGIDGFAPDTV